jgi:hypothetical protein
LYDKIGKINKENADFLKRQMEEKEAKERGKMNR